MRKPELRNFGTSSSAAALPNLPALPTIPSPLRSFCSFPDFFFYLCGSSFPFHSSLRLSFEATSWSEGNPMLKCSSTRSPFKHDVRFVVSRYFRAVHFRGISSEFRFPFELRDSAGAAPNVQDAKLCARRFLGVSAAKRRNYAETRNYGEVAPFRMQSSSGLVSSETNKQKKIRWFAGLGIRT